MYFLSMGQITRPPLSNTLSKQPGASSGNTPEKYGGNQQQRSRMNNFNNSMVLRTYAVKLKDEINPPRQIII